ncbi:phosphatidylcholine/phosphatidylserine synthase [Solwaraspora sp. WMMD406]|uniref:CDP-alcohol phosphatidyltransferase family protein n=1 Tax=Solwaraspora sp. WMMD406 TaxID=3016095 RepID=UPI002417410A|nr:phosphatidylcholine/phosphatidylserine synthase [Solwaraspora sp. WMMD406]MDG4763780.1 phosphatidylcholine/phosphatidylserine synthase [Solwaraspora sp. WMMD406]
MRRSGTFARQVLLVRVGRRTRDVHPRGRDGHLIDPRGRDGHLVDPTARYRLDPVTAAEIAAIAPVSPAIGPPRPAPTADDGLTQIRPATTVPLLPGAQTTARRLRFALVNATTLASLTLGLAAVFLAMQGDVRGAAGCLIACVVFDGLDGALARRLGVASPFGAQMDSLADMCSFGLAAPVVVYASLAGTVSTPAAAVACALVAACAAIRLARFNVSPKDGGFFTGVPTTLAAAVLALGVLIGVPVPGGVQVAGVALLAFAMVSSFPYVKLARLFRLPPWVWVLPVVGALIDVRLTFGVIVLAYLASGPLLWLHQRRPV